MRRVRKKVALRIIAPLSFMVGVSIRGAEQQSPRKDHVNRCGRNAVTSVVRQTISKKLNVCIDSVTPERLWVSTLAPIH